MMNKQLNITLAQQALEARRDVSGGPDDHSMEPVAEIDGVLYVNDSKATSVLATKASLKSIEGENVVLLIGGTDYKNDYTPLTELLKEKVKVVIYLGSYPNVITKHVEKIEVPFKQAASLEEAMSIVSSAAKPGDVVLLSPACPSFDPFDNYKNRGNKFKKLINQLQPNN